MPSSKRCLAASTADQETIDHDDSKAVPRRHRCGSDVAGGRRGRRRGQDAAATQSPWRRVAPATAPARPEIYAPFTLTADLSGLTANERRMLGLFIDAAAIMDDLFWRQAYGNRDALLA